MRQTVITILLTAAAISAWAQQPQQRHATPLNGRPGEGRCVAEVVVDGAAEVEIRGDNALLRNLKGQTPQWRRFECTSPMPQNAPNFRFNGIDGRGRQELAAAPQGNGPAVIRIDDPDNGSEGYTFEVTWGGMDRGQDRGQDRPIVINPAPGPMYPGGGRDDRDMRNVRPRMAVDDAVRMCQSYVREQAANRFRAYDVTFRRTALDDQPGRNDWVTGFFEARLRGGMVRNYRFSCSVDFNDGNVRSADIQPTGVGPSAFGDIGSGRAIQGCEVSVQQRLSRDGFQRIDFGSVKIDDRPGRNDWVVGAVTALDRDRPVWFDFNCSVDLRDGTVRSAEVNRRELDRR